MLEQLSMNSSKPEASTKMISNKRSKRKFSDLEDASDQASGASDDVYEADSESSNDTRNVSTDSRIVEKNSQTIGAIENNGVEDDESPQTPITNTKTDFKQNENNYISTKCVNDRKLFMSCVNGDINRYKFNIKLESSNLQTVWIGVFGAKSLKYYISTKNSDGSMNSFFISQNEKMQFDSFIKSFMCSNDVNFRCGAFPQSSLEYTKVDNNLVINQISRPKNTITFDGDMLCKYWSQHWLLKRFVEYLQKRASMLIYTEYIMNALVKNENGCISMNDFMSLFDASTPPNRIFTANEMWHYFLKRNLGY